MVARRSQLELACEEAAETVAKAVKDTAKETIFDFLTTNIDSLATEGEFYKNMNEELLSGLKGIYKEINIPSSNKQDASETSKLLQDTSNRLEEVMQTTKSATDTIMACVEKLFAENEEAATIIATIEDEKNQAALSRLDALLSKQNESLTEILTACSFEDLTGQRLLKIMEAVDAVKNTVFDLYLSSGLMLKGKAKYPDKDTGTLMEESRQKAKEIKKSELKGPSASSSSQDDVDDLLASLGL